jgi:hypothetical protein
MSLQTLLSTDYSKTLKEFFRFAIVAINLMVFYYFCGLRRENKFGPSISEMKPFAPYNTPKTNPNLTTPEEALNDPLRYTSTLDMLAFIMAIYVAMKQLTFGRPEIDSFRETIVLLPQEKRSAMMLLLFTIFKLVYQFFYKLKPDWGKGNQHGANFNSLVQDIIHRGIFMLKKVNDKEGIMNSTTIQNIFLVVTAALCVASSHIFKLEIRIAEKRMVLRIVKVFSLLAQLGLLSTIIYIMFIGENKCVCLVFIFMLLIDAIRAIKLSLYSSKKKRGPDIKDYLITLKWFTFFVMSLLISSAFFYNIVRCLVFEKNPDGAFNSESNLDKLPPGLDFYRTILKWMDNFLLFFERNSVIPRIVACSN